MVFFVVAEVRQRIAENNQEVEFSGASLLICKAMETCAARNLRESHGMLRNKSKELATVQS